MPSRYKIITKEKEIDQLISYVKQTRYFSHDFETSGGSFASDLEYPTILGVSFQPGSSYIIPLGHTESPFKHNFTKILEKLNDEILQDPEIIKIAWNFKFEQKWMMKYGCNYKGRCFDGMLAKYCLNEERPNDLKSIVSMIFPEFENYEDEVASIAKKVGWANVPLETLSKYCGRDSDLTLRLMIYFENKLISSNLYTLFRNLIMTGSNVLAESEFVGMPVDTEYLDNLISEYSEKIETNEANLRNHVQLKKFEKYMHRQNIKKLIQEVEEEIEQIRDEDKPNAARLIKAREEKLSRYISGNMSTNKEKKLIEPFNFNSPKQLINLLYSKKGFKFPILKYTVDKKNKRETDTPSTDEETLEMLKPKDRSGFIDQLLNHRGLTKLYGTYMVGMKQHITPDGRTHANFKIHGTVTGRLSCGEPNLQNIPRGDNPDAAKIKRMFVAPKDFAILQIDYSQAELRVMAEAANETSMLEWFRTGKDIHLASACKKYNYDYDKALKIYEDESHPEYKLWKKRRKQAKTINFGIIYCQTAKKLAGSLSEPPKYDDRGNITTPAIVVTKEEAQGFLDSFNKDFPRVIQFMKKQRKTARDKGYVTTFFGRKRRLPNIYSSVDGIRTEAERQSINAPIQGTASDFAFFSSVLIREYVIKNKKQHWGLQQIYTVHDSLGFLIKPKYIHEAVPVINAICENPQTQRWFGFSIKKVRMAVDFEVGTNWAGLKKYDKNINYTKILK